MCGIAGIYDYRGKGRHDGETELIRIRDAMSIRGPDGAGSWASPSDGIFLGHRRLAIIDLSPSAAQPMSTSDGRLTISFNGEIYNYKELRSDLQRSGVKFETESDTEVILHLYAMRGPSMLGELRGMFALAIWDSIKRVLFVARDPFGIKPLYFSNDGFTFRFASQVKALLKSDSVNTELEPAGSVGFFIWGAVPEPYTLYKGIRALPPGSYMVIGPDDVASPIRYYSITDELVRGWNEDSKAGETDIRALLLDSVKHHLVADVPVGIFLSSGIDSSVIATLAREIGTSELRTITLGFREFVGTENDETPLAERIAGNLGARHETHWITRQDFQDELPTILSAMDQPSIDGVNTYFVSRAARRAGLKVALSGLGGDELFAGYPGFRQIPALVQAARLPAQVPYLGRAARHAAGWLARLVGRPKAAGLLEYSGTYERAYLLRRALFMPWELKDCLDPDVIEQGLEALLPGHGSASLAGLHSPRQKVTALEFESYLQNQLLRDADWAGMANSVEIRTPLVDRAVFASMAPLLSAKDAPTKKDLARAVQGRLPNEVLSRRKTGFITPIGQWLGGSRGPGRGGTLRQWARRAYANQFGIRVLALITDAFGGRGGIAKFNRDLLAALCSIGSSSEVVAIPRLASAEKEPIPSRLHYVTSGLGGKFRYILAALRETSRSRFDVVVIGHMNLAPLGIFVARLLRTPSVVIVHGIDAWTPPKSLLSRIAVRRVDRVLGVSNITLERFADWSGIPRDRMGLLPNSVDLQRYTPGEKPLALAQEFGVVNRTVIMTLGRLDSFERYKGFDEVLDVLPDLVKLHSQIVYMICGDGSDRDRLVEKAAKLGVRDHVIFAGFVPEERKADFYRLADAFVMPSRGEGFGIVLLEAMACGTPTMGSTLDGSREALLDGKMGVLVDPRNREDVLTGILRTLSLPKSVPTELPHFSLEAFNSRVCRHMQTVLGSAIEISN
jgi:asparagine synthase (glutamine-hydrolysing)